MLPEGTPPPQGPPELPCPRAEVTGACLPPVHTGERGREERPRGQAQASLPCLTRHSSCSPLTVTEAGDAEGLRSVQREAVLHVLDVGHDWHGVEVGLQGQLLQIPSGLHLQGQGQWVKGICAPLGHQGAPV